MDAQTLFNEKMPKALEKAPEKAKEVNAVFLFKVTGDKGGTWIVDLKSDPPAITAGEDGPEPECTIELTSEDFETTMSDPQMGMQLMFQGKIKVTGDPMLATKLQTVFTM